jgi:predicted DNA-binding transcriptional regulator AlpA
MNGDRVWARTTRLQIFAPYLQAGEAEMTVPKPIYLSARKLAWREAEIDEWIQNKIELTNYKAD